MGEQSLPPSHSEAVHTPGDDANTHSYDGSKRKCVKYDNMSAVQLLSKGKTRDLFLATGAKNIWLVAAKTCRWQQVVTTNSALGFRLRRTFGGTHM